MQNARTKIYARIAREAFAGPRPCVIGVNGLDCSGKTQFAQGLVDYLHAGGHVVTLLHIDDFNDPDVQKAVYDAFTSNTFTAAHLDQFYTGSIDYGRAADAIRDAAKGQGTLVVEGVFLYKAALLERFTYRVYLEVSQSVGRARYATRRELQKDPRPLAVFDELWMPAHERYLREYQPREHAHLLVDNSDWKNPLVPQTQSPGLR